MPISSFVGYPAGFIWKNPTIEDNHINKQFQSLKLGIKKKKSYFNKLTFNRDMY